MSDAKPLPGRFITFEGIDGSGKSTQLELCAQTLQAQGHPVLATRNPGGTPLGKRIRELVLHYDDGAPMNPTAELMLYMADRAQHMAEVVLPALAQGITVLCDRHGDSTLAYQGYGRGLDHAMIRELNHIACQGRLPDATFLFDGAPMLLRQRVAKRGAEDRLEREALAFYEKVRDGFLAIAAAEPQRVIVFDAEQPMEAIQRHVEREIAKQAASSLGR